MPRCLIAAFSQGGATVRIAESIAVGLRRAGWEVDVVRLDGGLHADPSAYDLIGFGSPAHYFRLPFPVTDALRALPALGGKPAFTFILHGTYAGDAEAGMRKALADRGARLAGSFRARGADRFLGYLKLGVLFSPDHPDYEEMVRAERFGGLVAARLSRGVLDVAFEQDRPLPAIYRIQRMLASRWLVRHLYSRLFRVDPAKCTACDVCMKLCPVANLRPGEGGRPVWGRGCTLCLACEATCPKEAIRSPVTSFFFRPLLRMGVRRASAEPALDVRHVKHRRGRSEPV